MRVMDFLYSVIVVMSGCRNTIALLHNPYTTSFYWFMVRSGGVGSAICPCHGCRDSIILDLLFNGHHLKSIANTLDLYLRYEQYMSPFAFRMLCYRKSLPVLSPNSYLWTCLYLFKVLLFASNIC